MFKIFNFIFDNSPNIFRPLSMLGGFPGYENMFQQKDAGKGSPLDRMQSDQGDEEIGVCLNMPGLIQQQKKMCTKWPETVQ